MIQFFKKKNVAVILGILHINITKEATLEDDP